MYSHVSQIVSVFLFSDIVSLLVVVRTFWYWFAVVSTHLFSPTAWRDTRPLAVVEPTDVMDGCHLPDDLTE